MGKRDWFAFGCGIFVFVALLPSPSPYKPIGDAVLFAIAVMLGLMALNPRD